MKCSVHCEVTKCVVKYKSVEEEDLRSDTERYRSKEEEEAAGRHYTLFYIFFV